MNHRRARGLARAGLLVALLGGWSPARAQEAAVVLVSAPHPTAVVAEALVRLRGELSAAGFAVDVAETRTTFDLRTALTAATARPNVRAAIAVGGTAGQEFAELWINDRDTGGVVIRRVIAAELPRGAEVLSIRALETLRAALLEVAPDAPVKPAPAAAPAPAPPTVARQETEAGAPLPRPRFALEVGGLVLGSFEGLSPAVLALVRGERVFGTHLMARLTLAGLGTRARVASDAGAAEVSQQLGMMELAVRFRVGTKLEPFLSLGAGATHVSAQGQATWPYQGQTAALWAAVADAGVGVRVPLGERLQLAGELHGQGSYPYPVVRFLEATLARGGRPTVAATLSVVAWM